MFTLKNLYKKRILIVNWQIIFFQPVVKFLAMWRAVLAALRWVGGHDIYEKDDNHTVVLMIIKGGMSITGLLLDHDIVFDKDYKSNFRKTQEQKQTSFNSFTPCQEPSWRSFTSLKYCCYFPRHYHFNRRHHHHHHHQAFWRCSITGWCRPPYSLSKYKLTSTIRLNLHCSAQ